MSKIDTMFRTFAPEELEVRSAGEAELGLTGIEILESDPEQPDPFAQAVTQALPYAVHAQAYRSHVEECTACQDSPVYDIECETGNDLAAQAADACARQAVRSILN